MENNSTRRQLLAGLAASTIAAGSAAKAAPKPAGATPETLNALQTFYARRNLYDTTPSHGEEADQQYYRAYIEAEIALLTSPTLTPEDVALKLEYALELELCGGVYGADMYGLDDAMFRDMIAALRGPITDAIKVGG